MLFRGTYSFKGASTKSKFRRFSPWFLQSPEGPRDPRVVVFDAELPLSKRPKPENPTPKHSTLRGNSLLTEGHGTSDLVSMAISTLTRLASKHKYSYLICSPGYKVP